jgi:GR25 family glycosyltransferase involved in LPS biosynthesis
MSTKIINNNRINNQNKIIILINSMKKITIYFIHSKELSTRQPFCEKLIQTLKTSFDVNVQYIDENDATEIDIAKIQSFVKLDKPGTNDIFDVLIKNLHVRQLSNALKHFEAYKKIFDSDDDYSLILEDDVLFSNDVNSELMKAIKAIKKIKENWHIVFTGMPHPADFKIDAPITKTTDVFKIIPVCDSYFVNKKTVKELIDAFSPIRYITNIQLSYIMTHKKIETFMYSPNVFIDGSKYGVFLSSLEANNKLFFNNDYNKLVGLIRKEEYSDNDTKDIESLMNSIQFKEHPDIQYQFGFYEMRRKNYKEAKVIFDSIYEIYTKNSSLVNNESEFLFNYCNLFAHLQ